PASGAAVLNGAPTDGEVQSAVFRSANPHPAQQPPEQQAQVTAAPSDRSGQAQGDDDAAKARHQAWQTYYTEIQQLQKDRLSAAQSAMTADTGLSNSEQRAANGGFSATGGGGTGQTVPGVSGAPPGYVGSATALGGYGTGSGLPVY